MHFFKNLYISYISGNINNINSFYVTLINLIVSPTHKSARLSVKWGFLYFFMSSPEFIGVAATVNQNNKKLRKLSEVMIAAGSGHILSKKLHDATQRRGRLRLPPLRFSPSSQEPQLHSLSYLKVSAGAQSAAFSPLGSLVARCSSVPEPV